MLTIEPEFRPYSALKVKLSIFTSCTVFDGRLECDLVLNRIADVDAVDHEVDVVFTLAGGIEREGTLPAQRRRQEPVRRRS